MALTRKPKSVRIAIRIGVEEADMLNQLIEETGMLASDVIRQAIRGHYFTSRTATKAAVDVLGVKLSAEELAHISGVSKSDVMKELRTGATAETFLRNLGNKNLSRARKTRPKKK